MTRIFSSLAAVAVVLMVIAIILGFLIGFEVGAYNKAFAARVAAERQLTALSRAGDTDQADQLRMQIDASDPAFRTGVSRATWHMLTGIVASIVAILVSSISVTYFIGTSRWCKEVVDTYALESKLASDSTRLKRKSFPWAFIGIVSVLVVSALGGASDPATGLTTTGNWVTYHFLFAVAGVAIVTVSFIQQARYIRLNSELVETILLNVREVRRQRGLEVDEPEGAT